MAISYYHKTRFRIYQTLEFTLVFLPSPLLAFSIKTSSLSAVTITQFPRSFQSTCKNKCLAHRHSLINVYITVYRALSFIYTDNKMNCLALGSTAFQTTSLVSISTSAWTPKQRVSTISCRASSLRTKSNFYSVLSINSPESTGADDIKRAYRAMALRYHPDVCQDPSMKEESVRMFVLLHEAYKTLSDPILRSEYDFELGLSRSGRKSRSYFDFSPSLWRDQLSELRKMSGRGTGRKDGSWGSRMREQNRKANK